MFALWRRRRPPDKVWRAKRAGRADIVIGYQSVESVPTFASTRLRNMTRKLANVGIGEVGAAPAYFFLPLPSAGALASPPLPLGSATLPFASAPGLPLASAGAALPPSFASLPSPGAAPSA